jgi:hypothetical protein
MVSKYLCDRLDWPLEASEGEKVKGKGKETKETKKETAVGVECSMDTGTTGDEIEPGAGRKRATEGLMDNADSNSWRKSPCFSLRDLPHASVPSSSSSATDSSSSSCAPPSSPPNDFDLECCETSERIYRVSASRLDYTISRSPVTGVRNGILGPHDANDVKVEREAKVKKGAKAQKILHHAANDGASSGRRGVLPSPPLPSQMFEEGAGDLRCRLRGSITTAPVAAAVSANSPSSSRVGNAKKPKSRTGKRESGRSMVRNSPKSPTQQPAPRRGGSAGRSTIACVSATGTRSSFTAAGPKSVPVGRKKVGRPLDRPHSQPRSRSPAIRIAPEAPHKVLVDEKRKRGRPKKT